VGWVKPAPGCLYGVTMDLQWQGGLSLTVVTVETVGHRTRPVSDPKIGLARGDLGLGLAGVVLCCETRSCYARRQNDLEQPANFQVLFIHCVPIKSGPLKKLL